MSIGVWLMYTILYQIIKRLAVQAVSISVHFNSRGLMFL